MIFPKDKREKIRLLLTFASNRSDGSKVLNFLFAIYYFVSIELKKTADSKDLGEGAVSDDAYPLF
jgi:hypothetical protein